MKTIDTTRDNDRVYPRPVDVAAALEARVRQIPHSRGILPAAFDVSDYVDTAYVVNEPNGNVTVVLIQQPDEGLWEVTNFTIDDDEGDAAVNEVQLPCDSQTHAMITSVMFRQALETQDPARRVEVFTVDCESSGCFYEELPGYEGRCLRCGEAPVSSV